ncbi:cytochrome c peroxidase [Loktanella ponticola]|uniref:Cytochrome c peroxidase n=1 Tax=Yoonia ponticola TaxID=1524255 RepID=A0A7W9EY59_9RHOB|nr:cytochrome c peroxidase [Yoonia ponticola]MBB5722349.1 cytochrome c peroxidase [Yoonia ponticola]
MLKTLKISACFVAWASLSNAQALPDAITDDAYASVNLGEARLGQLLFYDPILSGNKTVACATCHHPAFGTADGVSLSIGDGGIGLGPDRIVDPDNIPEQRIPRNAPALFNLGAHEFTVMFHDGRLEADASRPGGIRTPMDADMVTGFASVLSAQTMFPVLSRDEMAGSHRENEIGRAVRQGLITGEGGAWDLIARRVADIPEYAAMMMQVYPHVTLPNDIEFTDISDAIAVFMAHEWRSDTSEFDAVLRGEGVLTGQAKDGMNLFYGTAGCAGCHSGPFLTDHGFHAMGAPQIGPGKSETFEDHYRDEGRFRVTGNTADLYAFRTPSLRNVALTAPYGHAGAHKELRAFIAAHTDPAVGLANYDQNQAVLPAFDVDDFTVMNDAAQVAAISNAVTTRPVTLREDEITALIAFLDTLTDPQALTGRLGIPDEVPSGLPVPAAD